MTAGLIGAITNLALRREVTVKPISETRSLGTHSHPSKEKDLAIFCHRVALLAERVAKPRTLLGWPDFGR
jgi:hypothetical protein